MGKSALMGMGKGLQRMAAGGAKFTKTNADKRGGMTVRMAKWGSGRK